MNIIPMTEENRQLVEDNIKLAYKFFSAYNIKDEDKQQELLFVYCNAVSSYNPEISSLSTFIYKCLFNALIKIRKEELEELKIMSEYTLESNFSNNDDNDLSLEDILGEEDDSINKLENKMLLESIFTSFREKYPDIPDDKWQLFLECLDSGNIQKVAKDNKININKLKKIYSAYLFKLHDEAVKYF